MQALLLILLLFARVLSGCLGASYDDAPGSSERALPEGRFSCDVVSAREGWPFHTCLESSLPEDGDAVSNVKAACNRHNRSGLGRGFSTSRACHTVEPGCSCRSKVLADPETWSTEFHYRADFDENPDVHGPWDVRVAVFEAQCEKRPESEWVCFGGETARDVAESEWLSAR